MFTNSSINESGEFLWSVTAPGLQQKWNSTSAFPCLILAAFKCCMLSLFHTRRFTIQSEQNQTIYQRSTSCYMSQTVIPLCTTRGDSEWLRHDEAADLYNIIIYSRKYHFHILWPWLFWFFNVPMFPDYSFHTSVENYELTFYYSSYSVLLLGF